MATPNQQQNKQPTPPTTTPTVDVPPATITVTTTDTPPVVEVTNTNIAPTVSEFAAVIDNLRINGTPAQKETIIHLETYINNMAPGVSQTEHTGTQNQLTLWHFLNSLVNRDQEEFKRCWAIVLFFFKEHATGALGDMYVARYFNAIRLDDASSKAFQHLLDLCILTADSKTRAQAMRQMDLNRALSVGLTEQAKANIISFYS